MIHQDVGNSDVTTTFDGPLDGPDTVAPQHADAKDGMEEDDSAGHENATGAMHFIFWPLRGFESILGASTAACTARIQAAFSFAVGRAFARWS